jgi:ferrochelatase
MLTGQHVLNLCLGTLLGLSVQLAHADEKVGVLFGSYGDVDNPQTELKELVTNTLTDPDVLPLPGWLNQTVAQLGWQMDKDALFDEYAAIGNSTNMRANSQAQADAVAAQLQAAGIDAKGYRGFTMTFPYVKDTLAQIQQDQVDRLVVFYQGAQYSKVTAQIVFRHVREYLAQHPDWDIEVIAVRSFSYDRRFIDLLISNIENRLATTFADIPRSDMCIFLPMHGNVMKWINEGDPSLDQMMYVVDQVASRFPQAYVSHGFQNHDELPLVEWTEPNTDTALTEVASQPCSGVLINGQISFTVDSLETLYDHGVAEPEFLQNQIQTQSLPDKKIFVEPMWNSDPEFVDYLATLTEETLMGMGDLSILRY